MFCVKCGVKNEDGSKFCYNCGTEFDPEEEFELPELPDLPELPAKEDVIQAAAQPAPQTVQQPTSPHTYQSTTQTVQQTASQPVLQSATQSVSPVTPQAVPHPSYQPVSQTTQQPVYQPASQPAYQQAPQVVQQPVYQTVPQQPVYPPAPQVVQQPVYQTVPQQPVYQGVGRPAPSVIPASMATNAATVSSNAGMIASNSAVVASNAALAASNAGVMAGSAAVATSNAAVVASNTAVVAATGMSTAVKVLVALLCTAVIVACCAFFIPLNEYGDTLSDFILGNAYWDPDMNDVYHAVEGFESAFNERDLSGMLDYFPPSVSSYFRMYVGIADIIGGFFGLDGIFTEEMLGTAFGFALQDNYIDIEVLDISFNSSKTQAYVTVLFTADGETMQDTLTLMRISDSWYLSEEYFDMEDLYPSFG